MTANYEDSLRDDCLLSAITALKLIAVARNQREVTDLEILISAYEQRGHANRPNVRGYNEVRKRMVPSGTNRRRTFGVGPVVMQACKRRKGLATVTKMVTRLVDTLLSFVLSSWI